ncbi:hypothetical protein K0B04_02810 [Patescibacteria group bacterium]|nr:hypothetical protein [Patescibacteria group bacterium]
MSKIVKLSIFTIALNLLGFFSFAFTLPETEIFVGKPVYIENTDPEKFYAIFLPFEEPTNGEVCASMSGEELIENNNLRNYGTCFINDEGIFTIVEISEPFSSSYKQLVDRERIIQEAEISLTFPDNYDEILDPLGFLDETKETTSSTESSEETSFIGELGGLILGTKTINVLGVIRQNYLVIITIFLLVVSVGLLTYLLLDKNRKKQKKK